VKLVHLVGFITKKFFTMHDDMNVKLVFPSFTALSVLRLMWLFKLLVFPLRILWCKVNVECILGRSGSAGRSLSSVPFIVFSQYQLTTYDYVNFKQDVDKSEGY